MGSRKCITAFSASHGVSPPRLPTMLLKTLLVAAAAVASAAPNNAKAGGAGYAYSFDGLEGTTISMQWAHNPISQLTIEYWMNIMVRAAQHL